MKGAGLDFCGKNTDMVSIVGIKDFTKWPTIPQVFVNGEFVGGCDIMIQMHRSGEFMEVLRKAGIDSKIPDPPSPNSNDGPDESSSKSESKK